MHVASTKTQLPNGVHLLSTYHGFGTALFIICNLFLFNPYYIHEIRILIDEETQAQMVKDINKVTHPVGSRVRI